jgi:thiamine-monophosphate kinase
MKLSETGELRLIDMIRKKFRKKAAGIVVGIGDDCAVVKSRDGHVLLSTDMMVEGVHFDLSWMTLFQLGFKLVSVNVSDVYAMGGRPDYLLLNLAAPGDFQVSAVEELFDGIAAASALYRVSVIGGDVSSSDRLMLSAAVTGHADRVVSRAGAGVGDLVYVTGSLGDAAAGLLVLKRMKRPLRPEEAGEAPVPLARDVVRTLVERHVMPKAVRPDRIAAVATSMIDISDGLLIDLSRLCAEGRVGARIYAAKIPMSEEMKRAAEVFGASALELALSGGEDYQLLFTAPKEAKVRAVRIGEITRAGLEVVDAEGRAAPVEPRGYEHFAD